METVARPDVKIVIESVDVTRDLTPYLVSVQYRDSTEAQSDSLELYLTSDDDRFAGEWYPPKGSKLQLSLGYKGNLVSTGTFDIDEVEYELLPYRITIRGIAALVTKGLRTRRSENYEDVSLVDIVRDISMRHGLRVMGNIDPRLILPRVAQVRETDLAFMSRLADAYGYNFALRNDLLYFSDIYDLEAADPITTIRLTDVIRASFRDETMKVKRAAKTRYIDPDRQEYGEETSEPPADEERRYEIGYGRGAINGVPFPSDGVTELGVPYVDKVNFSFLNLEAEIPEAAEAAEIETGQGAVNGVPFPSDGVTGKFSPFSDTTRFIFHRPKEINGTDEDDEYLFGGARSATGAAAMAKASIHKSSTAQIIGTLNMPGRPNMLAGSSILLAGFGDKFDGKHFITESTHDVGAGGYFTQLTLKKV